MASEMLRQFSQMILQDESLQRRLGAITDTAGFVREMQKQARERGYAITREDIESALRESRRVPPPVAAITGAILRHWIPAGINFDQSPAMVEWSYPGDKRFTQSFFDDTVRACAINPLNRLCRFQTPLTELSGLQYISPGRPPTGFIFHMSRCGSTLIAQMLAALPQNIVLSEAAPIDAVLSAQFRQPAISDEQRIAWLRAVISALCRKRHPLERNVFIKFDCWHALALPLIVRAFPDVPWIFVTRDPVEVMVSHTKERGRQMVPGIIDHGWFGIRWGVDYDFRDEYCARVLGAICRAAVEHHRCGIGRIVDYRELPEAVWTWLPGFFRAEFSPDDTGIMRETAGFHAKRPDELFSDDTVEKKQKATDAIRKLAEQWVAPHYEQLEALRRSQSE